MPVDLSHRSIECARLLLALNLDKSPDICHHVREHEGSERPLSLEGVTEIMNCHGATQYIRWSFASGSRERFAARSGHSVAERG